MLFYFAVTPTTRSYPLSLHDALPISACAGALDRRYDGPRHRVVLRRCDSSRSCCSVLVALGTALQRRDRKSTRLNSSHPSISYAVFCLKKKSYTELPTSMRA